MLNFLFLILSFLLGSWCFNWLDSEKRFKGITFLVLGFGLGLVTLGYLSLGLGLLLAQLQQGVVWGLVFVGLFLGWQFRPKGLIKERWQGRGFEKAQLILVPLAVVVVLVALQAMLWDAQDFPFGVLKGWGDGAYHLDLIMRLKTAEPFMLDQPIAGGEKLTYPFLIDFLSAILLKEGWPLMIAWQLPVVVFSLGMVLTLFELGESYLGKKSLALSLVFLVFVGSGLGFLWFFQQLRLDAEEVGWQESLKTNLLQPKFEYTHLDMRTGGKEATKEHSANIVWIVPLISFFSHQRSFLLGGFLGLLVLFGLLVDRQNWRWLLVLGLLPLAHTHSFVSLVIITLVFCFREILNSLRQFWFRKGVTSFLGLSFLSFLLALPQLVYLWRGVFSEAGGGSGFFAPWFGWLSCEHRFHWFFCDPGVAGTDSSVSWFWLKNFGLVWLVWLVALWFYLIRGKTAPARELVLPSLVLFALPNLFLFQPWPFDNNKILFWWWVLAILLDLSLFNRAGYQSAVLGLPRGQLSGASSLIFFVIFSSLAGMVDLSYRLQPGLRIEENKRHFSYYSRVELALADWINQNTSPNDIFLTHLQANQFVPMLTGRPIYLGFPGWLWTQGKAELLSRRQAKIREFIAQGEVAPLCQAGVRYWLREPQFFIDYSEPSSSQLAELGTKVFQLGEKEIIKLNCF